MAFTIKKKPVDYKAFDGGSCIARLVTIAGVGTQEEQDFKKKVPQYVDEVIFVFELIGHNKCHKDGTPYTIEQNGAEVPEPMTVRQTYRRSLNSKSKLTAHIRAWLNKDPSGDDKFDLEAECLGKACILSIGKKTAAETGNEYNFINGIMELVPGTPDPSPARTPLVCYDVNEHNEEAFKMLPDWIQETVKKSTEWAEAHTAATNISVSGGSIQPIGGPDF